VVVSIWVHRERIGEDPAAAEATVATATEPAPQLPPHQHPRDLEQEMIENENRTHPVQEMATPPQPEGRDASHVEHIEQGGERVQEHDDGSAGQHFSIEV
jgi:hypothetical protein